MRYSFEAWFHFAIRLFGEVFLFPLNEFLNLLVVAINHLGWGMAQ